MPPDHPEQPQGISRIDGTLVETDIPARLDRLPWGRFHWNVVSALGVTWILDGLEVTLPGTLANAIRESLAITSADIGFATTAYLLGSVSGALLFGWLADRFGRKKLFFITLTIYIVFTAATALSWNVWSFAAFRFLTGTGIGGECTAVNSIIQELIPSKHRGRVTIAVNGSAWVGALLGAAASILLLDRGLFGTVAGWRAAFFVGALLGCAIYGLRLAIPESPRWLMTHGRADEGTAIVGHIEAAIRRRGRAIPDADLPRVLMRGRGHTPLREVWVTLAHVYRRRTLVGLALMAAQAFFYNAIFFTYALVLVDFYQIPSGAVGWYFLPFAVGNFLGPLLLGKLFDSIGRRVMISATYALAGTALAATGALFVAGVLSAAGQTAAWAAIFFLASAAASAAYLTISETFPLEVRALAIAVFYAAGTGVGGALSPWLFGVLIDTGSRSSVFWGYLAGALLMIGAAMVQWRWGVAAEGKSLEDVARPLTFMD